MPAPRPDSTLIGQTWGTFVEGIANLNPNSAENLEHAYRVTQLPPGYENYVNIPGWKEGIVYPGRYSREEWEEQKRRIDGAVDYETAQSWGKMLTGIDNAQDIVISIGYLGYAAAWAMPQIFGRALPVVGGILLLSDLLNLLTLLGQLATPLYQLLCNGVGAGIAAGIPALVMGAGAKGNLWRAAITNPSSRRGFFRTPPNAILRPSGITLLSQGEAYRRYVGGLRGPSAIGFAIQAPQATSTLFGYGVALGAYVGLVTQTAAGAVIAAQGGVVNGPWTNTGMRLDRAINRALREDPPHEVLMLWRAASTMATVPAILRHPELASSGHYTIALLAALEASRFVFRRLHGYPWREILADGLEEPQHVLAAPSFANREHFAALGLRPGQPLPWDLPGNPLLAPPHAWMAAAAPEIATNLDRFIAQNRNVSHGPAAGLLATQLTEELWQQLADDPAPLEWTLTPDWAVAAAHLENNRVPAIVGDQQRLWSYWQHLRALHAARPVGKWTRATFDQVAQTHGVKLLSLLPPDAPLPEPWRAYLATLQHAPRP